MNSLLTMDIIDEEQLKRWVKRKVVHTFQNPEAEIADRHDSFTDALQVVRRLIAVRDSELDMYAEQMLEGFTPNESCWHTTEQGRKAVHRLLLAASTEDKQIALRILRSDRL